MWCFGTLFSGGLDSVRFMVGLDPEGLFPLEWFYYSIIHLLFLRNKGTWNHKRLLDTWQSYCLLCRVSMHPSFTEQNGSVPYTKHIHTTVRPLFYRMKYVSIAHHMAGYAFTFQQGRTIFGHHIWIPNSFDCVELLIPEKLGSGRPKLYVAAAS